MEPECETTLPAESVKVIAESIGIKNLTDNAAKDLAEEVSYRLKQILQDSTKFMRKGSRLKLTSNDIDQALKIKDIEPLYGFHAKDHTPFRFASGGGRELHYLDDKELDINYLLSLTESTNWPKLPAETSLRTHWLCVDGIQPTIPENPPPVPKEIQKLESIDPICTKKNKDNLGKPVTKSFKLRNAETAHVKQLATHELSVEQQLFYKEITEACVGADETRRAKAYESLSTDQGLYEMLPRLSTFISEGVRINVAQNNLTILIYLMRMVKALLDNSDLCLEKYLHEIIPSVATCIVSKQLCAQPEKDNHWALRDFASRLMGQICKNYNTSTNNIQTRITRIFSRALVKKSDLNTPLPTLYGAIHGLCELGSEVIKVLVIPKIKSISEQIEFYLEGQNQANIIDVEHIKTLIVKLVAPVIKTLRQPPDLVEDYKQEFGYIGIALSDAVSKTRTATTPITTAVITNSTNQQQQPQINARTLPKTVLLQPISAAGVSSGSTNSGHNYFILQPRPQQTGSVVQQVQILQKSSEAENVLVAGVSNVQTTNTQPESLCTEDSIPTKMEEQ